MKKLLTLTLALIAATGFAADKRFDQLNGTNVLFGTDIFPIEAAGSQKNFQVPWSLMANTAGAAATNYGNTIGANSTNFAYSIGANATGYVNTGTANLTSLVNTVSGNLTSYVNSVSNSINSAVWLTNATRGSPSVGTNVAAGQGLVWDAVNHVWTNGTVSAGGAFIDNNNGNGTNLTVWGTLTATNLDLDTLNVGTLYATNAPGLLTTNNSAQFIATTNGHGTNTFLDVATLTNSGTYGNFSARGTTTVSRLIVTNAPQFLFTNSSVVSPSNLNAAEGARAFSIIVDPNLVPPDASAALIISNNVVGNPEIIFMQGPSVEDKFYITTDNYTNWNQYGVQFWQHAVGGVGHVLASLNTNGIIIGDAFNNITNFQTFNSNAVVSGHLTTYGLDIGTPFTNAVLSFAASASNGPAHNEFPTAGWVRDLFAGSGTVWYNSTNLGPGFVKGAVPFLFITNIPEQFTRSYATPTNNQYVGGVGLTNQTAFSGPITVSAYLSATGGSGGTRGLSVKPEIYYSYDSGTNLLGNWDAQPQALALDQTNRYDFVVAVPTTITTGGVFTIYRVFKVTSATGATTPTLVIAGGTNTPGQISITGPSSLGGNAFLGVNQTFTGTNTFTQPVLSTSASASNSPAANELPNATWVAGQIGTLTNWNTVPLGQPGEMLMMLNTKPIWIEPSDMINDGMIATSASLSSAGGTSSSGGGGSSGFGASVPASGNRGNRNYFWDSKTYGTNGVGGTHFNRLTYNNGVNVLNLSENAFSFNVDALIETAFTNMSVQIGLLSSSSTSNQTFCIIYEANPVSSANWIAKSVNSTTNNWDTGIPIALNTWWTLGFSGNTNSIVFYTNGVAGFTNSTVSSIPVSSFIIGAIVTNCKTNSDAVGAKNELFIDKIKFLITTNSIR